MIASRRGLVALAIVALVLAAIVVIDPGGREPIRARTLVVGFEPGHVDSFAWHRSDGGDVRVEWRGGAWTVAVPQVYAADDAAIDGVLTALRGARWQRRAKVSRAGPVRSTLTVGAGERAWTIGIADPLPGAGETWLVVDGDALLVEDWVAHALDPPLSTVLRAHPFRGGFAKEALAVHRLDGGADIAIDLATGYESAPGQLRVDPARFAELVSALDALEVEPLGDPDPRQPPPPTDAGFRAILLEFGPRPDRVALGTACLGRAAAVAISSPDGEACVAADAFERVRAAVIGLTGDASAIVDRRPFAAAQHRLVLGDGTTVELGKRPMIGTQPAYAQGVDAVLAALAAPAAIAPLPATPPSSRLEVDGTTLDLYDRRLIARHGEPVALQPTPEAWLRITSTRLDVRGRITWLEEPLTISGIFIDDVMYVRGAVVGEWDSYPKGHASPQAVVSLVAAPAELETPPGPFTPTHHIAITITPPGGAPYDHAFEVGGHCAIRSGGEVVAVAPALCAALDRIARAP